MIIRYVSVSQGLNQAHFQALQKKLPEVLLRRNQGYLHYLDQQRNMFGLLLLKKMWKDQLQQSLELELLETTTFNRPYLPNSNIDFNISHAGNYVICALACDVRLGIDIEDRKEVDFDDFTRTMNSHQWKTILTSPDAIAKFFEYWSIKESVIKADGRGLSIPLTEITIHSETVTYADKTWYVKPFILERDHYGCLACSQIIPELSIKQVPWNDL